MFLERIARIPVLKSFSVVAAIVLMLELGGIWDELHLIRTEQVRTEQVRTEQIDAVLASDQGIPVRIESGGSGPIVVEAFTPIPVVIRR